MRILLTNDDGCDAFGLRVLEGMARTLSDDVWICAPAVEQSGMGRGITLHNPLRARKLGDKRFCVTGTPTDCVQIAVNDLMPSPPDLLLSGVNRGFNLAQDVTLSGTVAGALQGMSLGIPSIALSQCLDFALDTEAQWQAAQIHGPSVLSNLLAQGWPQDVVININFPDCRADAVAGVEVTRQGLRDFHEMHAIKRRDPRGRDYYWIDFHDFDQTLCEGTDMKAIAENRVSVTPLHLDLTHYDTLKNLRKGMVSRTLASVGAEKGEL